MDYIGPKFFESVCVMKQRLPFIFLLLSISISLFGKAVDFLPVPSKEIIKHTYYTLSYNEKYEQANWVYYVLTDSMVIQGGQERTNKFKFDKLVPTGSARTSDYTKSGYDRGHLCPAADMDFNQVAMEESFLMSNISPQAPDFNRGIWKDLETEVRNWAKKERRIYVVTGPVFNDNKGAIGEEQVLVPGYFFKILFDSTDKQRIIAFVLPNRKSDRPLTDFVVSADELEKLTGYDFFSQLPDDLENKLEGSIDLSGWFAGYREKPEQAVVTETPNKNDDKKSDTDARFYLVLAGIIVLVLIFVLIKGKGRK